MDKLSVTYSTFDTFKDDNLLFSYMGFLSNTMVINSIDLIERNIVKNKELKKIKRKLSFLMIESFQNIIRYGDTPEKRDDYLKEMFLVRNVKNHFYIVSVNLVENSKVKYVKEKLDNVNKLNNEELNKLYRKILTNNEFTDEGGAGLGFIEMARKTRQKLDFEFVKVDEKYSYFYLIIKVKEEQKSEENEIESNHIDIKWVKNFHESATKDELIVLHKGNISLKVIEPVTSMVEGNITNKELNIQNLALNLTLEIFETANSTPIAVSKESDSIFIISNNKKKKKNVISIGNYIVNKDIILLKQNLELLKNMNKREQKKLYESIANEKAPKENKSKIALSLINIAIECNNEFEYKFQRISENKSFYSFSVNV